MTLLKYDIYLSCFKSTGFFLKINFCIFIIILVQEAVVVSGLSVMTQWCKHITSEVPKQLLEAFKVF